MLKVRQTFIALVVLLMGILCVRVAAVEALGRDRPELAAKFWPGHPQLRTTLGLAAIGRAAAAGKAPDPKIIDKLRSVLSSDPLAAEPFTVAGAQALAMGEFVRARVLLDESVERNPRAAAPRYLRADLSFREGNLELGLRDVIVLTRQLGKTIEALAPALGRFARQPGAAARMKPVLDREPALKSAVLTSLAEDSSSAATILALAPPYAPQPDWATRNWQSILIRETIAAKNYPRAFSMWRQFTGRPATPGRLLDPDFTAKFPLFPFDWRFVSGGAGTAESNAGGGIDLMFYGREDANLAEQVTILAPGRQTVSWHVRGNPANLSLRVTCLPTGTIAGEAALAKGQLDLAIEIDCVAQRLELRGMLAEAPSGSGVRLSELHLSDVRDEK